MYYVAEPLSTPAATDQSASHRGKVRQEGRSEARWSVDPRGDADMKSFNSSSCVAGREGTAHIFNSAVSIFPALVQSNS